MSVIFYNWKNISEFFLYCFSNFYSVFLFPGIKKNRWKKKLKAS
jgi:hypothetical protein